jgi:RNA-directed DNA polymerase
VSAQRARTTLDKARELQRALYRAAKANPTRRFHALYDKMYREDVLAKAWREVRSNAGSAGVDGQTIEQIEQQGVEGLLTELAAQLREGRYRPHAVRRVRIPKPDGSQRGLGIPAVRDRVVQAAAKTVLEPIFEADFRDSSYGFRPKRSAHQAGEQLRQAVNRGANWVVEIDIEAFYDRIDHELLMKLVEKRVCDRRVLKQLRQWLKAGVLDGGEFLPSDQGVPQGGVISCVLANVVLHELDRLWEDRCSQLGRLIRYADDAVLLCRTEAHAREALAGRGHPEPSEADAPSQQDPRGLCRGRTSGLRLPRVSLPQGGILEVSWEALSATLAGAASDAAHPRQDQSHYRSPSPALGTRWADRGRSQPGVAPLECLLSSGELHAQVPSVG